MPRYYFNHKDGGIDIDTEGLELLDLEEAKREAIDFTADILKAGRIDMYGDGELNIEVQDDVRRVLFTIKILTRNSI